MPAETGSTFCEALAHGARRKWAAGVGIDVGVVEQAQLDWINTGRVGKFVHRALEREMSNGFVRRAQGGRSVTVHMNDFVIRPNALAGRPQRPRAERGIFSIISYGISLASSVINAIVH